MGTNFNPARTASFEFDHPRLLPKGSRPDERPSFEARFLTAGQLADVEERVEQAFASRGRKSLAHLLHALGLVLASGHVVDLQGKTLHRQGGDDETRWTVLGEIYEIEQLWQLYRAALQAVRPTDAELGKSASSSAASSASSADAAAAEAPGAEADA